MEYSFDKLQGPHQSRRENFEELISQLLSTEMGAEAVDGSGGDGGVDCFIRSDDDALVVFQVKYFIGRLTTSQRRQISQSLSRARSKHQISRWILCIPINPTPSERTWFESLSQDGLQLEWWGRTKIRTLLAKRPEVARSFFLDELLVTELNEFRREITGTLAALKASPWTCDVTAGSDSVAIDYLARASRIGELLLRDASLLDVRDNVYIGVDFSELHTYMSTDSRFVVATPVVDYCINNSPHSFYLLPGAAVELARFMNWSSNHTDFRQCEEKLTNPNNPLQHFIHSFEQNPSAPDAYRAYELAVEYLKSMRVPAFFNISKLRSVLESGKIKTTDSTGFSGLENRDLETIYQLLLRYGPTQDARLKDRFQRAKLVDARNLLFLRDHANETGQTVRLISSDRRLASVSREYFGKDSFVRDSSEFAYLVYSNTSSQTEQRESSLKLEAKNLVTAARALSEKLKRRGHYDPFSTSKDKNLWPLMNEFQAFAQYYRKMLRPVDEMIESGMLALSTMYSRSMLELYTILKRESDLLTSFKLWWDSMAAEFIAVQEVLEKRYFTDRTISEAKLRRGSSDT